MTSFAVFPRIQLQARSWCFAASLLFGCSEQNAAIEGTVFIVTQGAQSLKLGLVEVGVYHDSTLTRFMATRTEEVSSSFPRLRDRADSLARLRSALASRSEVLRDSATVHAFVVVGFERAARASGTLEDQRSFESLASEARLEAREVLGSWQLALQSSNQASARAESAASSRDSLLAADLYFRDLPAPVITTKTDADGKFRLSLPTARYAFVATATRQVGTSIERYYWMVRSDSATGDTTTIQLSNDNLFDTRCRQCYTGFQLTR